VIATGWAAVGPGLSEVLSLPFMRHAVLAGTGIALAAGLVGWFVVLRGQVFAGDALGHVAFTGALAALAAGFDLRLGLFVVTFVVALAMGVLGPRGQADDVVIGSVFAWILGLGVLFLSLAARSGSAGGAGVSVLFGSIFGLDAGQAALAALIGVMIAVALLAIARPLLFASVDAAVAAARGVPVRLLGVGFLGLVGLCAAEAAQAVGALLLLGLLAAPAATAHRLTARPYAGLALSAALAVLATWSGLLLSYQVPKLPPSTAIIGVATAVYALAVAATATRRRFGPATGSRS